MKTVALHPAWWEEGLRFVCAADPVMAGVVAQYPKSILTGRGAPFETLVRAVVGQQISVKAAASIWERLHSCTADQLNRGFIPEALLACSEEDLRGCGLSGQKVKYVRGIAAGFADGTVHPGLWDGMADEDIIKELVKLPGIGRWTAEMFLIFNLLRPDVLPVDDLGLLKGYVKVYGPVRGTAKLEGTKWLRKVGEKLRKDAKRWGDYRTVGVWFLWRSLDPVEVGY